MFLRSVLKKVSMMVPMLLILIVTLGNLPVLAANAKASTQAIIAEGYCVMDADTGEVILQKNMNDRYFPASTTKVLTALVTIENEPDLNRMAAFSDWAISSLAWDSSTLNPEAGIGEEMRLRDILYGMILVSGNECSNALAQAVAGSQEAFAELMNQRAIQAGAKNSHFVNAHGYHDENHYTTPYDLAMIFKAALQNPTFYEIDSTARYTIPATNIYPARELEMGHQMVCGNYDYPYALAGKTGSTPQAGRTLLTYAEKDDIRLICSIMKSTDEAFYQDTEKLLEEAFDYVKKERMDAADSLEGLNVYQTQAGTQEDETAVSLDETASIGESSSSSVHTVTETPKGNQEENLWIFWAVLAVTGVSFLVAVVLILLILRDAIRSRQNRKNRR